MLSKIKNILSYRISSLSPRLFFAIAYLHNRKHLPNFKHPKDLSEIWIKYVLDKTTMKLYYLADKYEVRKYVASKGLADILPPLLGCWDKPLSKEEFDRLPKSFALKMNYGAGMNIICKDKSKLSYEEVNTKLQHWFYNKEGIACSEDHYNLIHRKAICEQFIFDNTFDTPTDYKFICINGKPFCVLACFDRVVGEANYMPFTLDWEPLPHYNKDGRLYQIPRPKNLPQMVQMASTLAEGIELVRVDLYDTGSHVYFGEMTLTPAGCIFHTWSQQALDEMGNFYYKTKKDFVARYI